MTVHGKAAAAALVGAAPLLVTVLAAGPAGAHGAPVDPLSRAAACGPEGGPAARSAACKAAVAANGGPIGSWDNLRVADVRGRDRQLIPDGKLCGAGLAAYKGLDTARADWPAERLRAGDGFSLTYRSTIPHRGTFSLYLTKPGYTPDKPLTWDDLERKPFLSATDPALRNGSYRIAGKLPAGLTGRHMLYTIWRNTDTPDTYYSCSDVDFGPGPASASGGERKAGEREAGEREAGKGSRAETSPSSGAAPNSLSEAPAPTTAAPSPSPERESADDAAPAGSAKDDDSDSLPLAAGFVGVLAVATVIATAALRRRLS